MAYHQLEEIHSRRSEKIAMWLTLENAMGMILAAFPVFLLSEALSLLWRVPLVGGAALIGIVVTIEVHGMTSYERWLWAIRGWLRRRVHPAPISPADLGGALPQRAAAAPLPQHGPIRRRANAPDEATP